MFPFSHFFCKLLAFILFYLFIIYLFILGVQKYSFYPYMKFLKPTLNLLLQAYLVEVWTSTWVLSLWLPHIFFPASPSIGNFITPCDMD